MSLLTTSRVHDYEIGSRKLEIKSIREEIKTTMDDPYIRPVDKLRILNELKATLKSCQQEYRELSKNVRQNFV